MDLPDQTNKIFIYRETGQAPASAQGIMSVQIVPGSLYWNLGVGTDKGDVSGDEEAMRNMNHLGETIAWLGAAMAAVPENTPFPKVRVELH